MQIKTITLSLDVLARLISLPEGLLIAAVKSDRNRAFEVIVADPDDKLPSNAIFNLEQRKWIVPVVQEMQVENPAEKPEDTVPMNGEHPRKANKKGRRL